MSAEDDDVQAVRNAFRDAQPIAETAYFEAALARLEARLARLEWIEEAADELVAEASRAVTEPRRFHQNEDQRQQALGAAITKCRTALAATEEGAEG